MSKDRKKLVKQLDDIFSLYIRERDNYTCVVCGKQKPNVVIQAGHYFSRKHYSTRWNEINVNAQCSGCNRYHNDDKEPYREKMITKYGQVEFDKLYAIYRKTTKFYDADLKYLIKVYKEKLKELS